jgi:hypothetical protein
MSGGVAVLAWLAPGSAFAAPPEMARWLIPKAGTVSPVSMIAAMVCLAALAGMVFALGMIAAAERRLRELDQASRSALGAGGKLIENAARRLMAAQDEHRQEAEQSAGQAGQAGSRLIGAAREVEGRLRRWLDEAEARLREPDFQALRHGQVAAALTDAGEGVEARIAEACAAAVEAIERHATETARAGAVTLEAGTRESLTAVKAVLDGGEAEIMKAAASLRPLVAQCVEAGGWVATVKQDFAALHAHAAAMESALAMIETAGRQAERWPAIADALVQAAESVRLAALDDVRRDGPHQNIASAGQGIGATELGDSIALVKAAMLARDDAAERVVEAAMRTEEAADRVAAMIGRSGKGEAARSGQGLLMQVDALHADAGRLAAAADQGGILPCIQDQVTVLAADILRAMERLHATSTLLASAAAGRRMREAGGSVRQDQGAIASGREALTP